MIRTALLALALCSCTAPRTPPAVVQAKANTVVLDERCSGVLLRGGRLLTAGHCVEPAEARYEFLVTAVSQTGSAFGALLDQHDEWRDLALLRTRQPSEAGADHVSYPTPGDVVFVVHHTCPGGWCVDWARVVYTRNLVGYGALGWTAAHGASGSGVWAADGGLVGIVVAVGTGTGNTYYSPIGDLL